MKATIYGIPNCQKCKQAKAEHQDWDYVELTMEQAVAAGRTLNIREMPIIVLAKDN